MNLTLSLEGHRARVVESAQRLSECSFMVDTKGLKACPTCWQDLRDKLTGYQLAFARQLDEFTRIGQEEGFYDSEDGAK